MEKFNRILLQVWREACRDIEIEKSCAVISSMLLQHLPLYQVLVCGFDQAKKNLETLAVGFSQHKEEGFQGIRHYSQKEWRELMSLFRQKSILHKTGSLSPREQIDLIFADHADVDVLIGPLEIEKKVQGLLILVSNSDVIFSSDHRQMLQVLLEPFSIALHNNLKLREINVLRETAEADKYSLLQRLSRKSLGDIIIGADSGLKSVMERMHLVSRSDVPVMILGETGTGKELISREIHRLSPRADGPFIRINCGSIPPELIDSQLFGHEKGSFTGAVSSHKGWFERASGGTLFLDEIGELPLAGQVRLLRIIQDGWLERVGGKQPIHVDVRTVIATNRDLAEMVKTGRFREDLWYRLSVFPIRLPSLRERLEDMPALATHFAERAAIRFNLAPQLPTKEDIELLCSYPWPGNIRELASVIDRAAILGDGHGLKIAAALGLTQDASPPSGMMKYHSVDSYHQGAFPPLDRVVKDHIEQALTRTKGKIEGPSGAAKLLDVHPNTLRARMRKLGVQWKQFRE
jgi:hydrogenase-4 transcriptional activator